MRRISYRSHLLLILFFILIMSVPRETTERMRSYVIASFSPCWRSVHFLKEKILLLLPISAHSPIDALELERLSQENHTLHSQLENVREWLLNEDRISEQVAQYQFFSAADAQDGLGQRFFKRRSEELRRALELQLCSLPAKVIFREPVSWSSTLWINVGEKDNQKLQQKIICKNSPVLLGKLIVGAVEYVGDHRSRVRLITDSRLTPSVRACRGNEQNRHLFELLE